MGNDTSLYILKIGDFEGLSIPANFEFFLFK